jgi:two-component system response regulator HydG
MSRVLLVDDEVRFLQATSEALRQRGHSVATANCLAAARDVLRGERAEFVLLDLMLPDGNGLELLEDLSGHPPAQVALITGHPSIKAHIQSLVGPTVTYFTKPVDIRDILRLIEDDEPAGPDEGSGEKHFGFLLGESPGMQKVYQAIERFGPTSAAVLIEGESGTGKELVAQALHVVSGRRGRFVPTNCGALAGELVASELFGHEKGSFTGATRRHAGVFERADGGTLFLDEISEMPLDMQTFLLRSLETGEIVRVGGEEETKINARLLAATNRSLSSIVRDGIVREDLYYRISECIIRLPPLRERGDDIAILVDYFIDGLNERYGADKSPSPQFLEYCKKYSWPGNVRELKHVVHRAYLMMQDPSGEIEPEVGGAGPVIFESDSVGVHPGRAIRDVERELIFKTLEHFSGDKRAAADALGISLKTLYNRLNEYNARTGER